jgi:hypothetical protein
VIECIKGSGGRLAAVAIKRFKLFESVSDPEDFSDAMNALWREKHGHSSERKIPKAPKRVKTDAYHKYCNGCERVLSVGAFSVDRSRARGLANRCRECAAKNWKQTNHHVCKSCESWCVGQVCRRCMTIRIRVRYLEAEIAGSVSFPIWSTQRAFQIFAEQLAENKRLSPSEKLQALLQWKPENSQN